MDLKDSRNKKVDRLITLYLHNRLQTRESMNQKLGWGSLGSGSPEALLFPTPFCCGSLRTAVLFISKGPRPPAKRSGFQALPGPFGSSLQRSLAPEESLPLWIHVGQMWANDRRYPAKWCKTVLSVFRSVHVLIPHLGIKIWKHVPTQVFLIVHVGSVCTGTLQYKFLGLYSPTTKTFISMLLQVQPGISYQKIFRTILVRWCQWL